jgi:hypothetical protein
MEVNGYDSWPARFANITWLLGILFEIYNTKFGENIFVGLNAVRSESRCALIEDVGSQLKEPQWVKTELNNYTLYRYCTSTAVSQPNTVK